MRIVREVITFEEVVDELVDVSESIDDLSLIRFEFVKDSHWESLELNVSIFGAGDPDDEGPVLEFAIETDPLFHEDHLVQGIICQKIPALFDADLLDEIVGRNIPVVWNQDDETEVYINLADPGNDILLPIIR